YRPARELRWAGSSFTRAAGGVTTGGVTTPACMLRVLECPAEVACVNHRSFHSPTGALPSSMPGAVAPRQRTCRCTCAAIAPTPTRARSSETLLRPVGPAASFAILVQLLVQVQPFEHELDGCGHQARALERAESRHRLAQPRNLLHALAVLRGRHTVRHLDPP